MPITPDEAHGRELGAKGKSLEDEANRERAQLFFDDFCDIRIQEILRGGLDDKGARVVFLDELGIEAGSELCDTKSLIEVIKSEYEQANWYVRGFFYDDQTLHTDVTYSNAILFVDKDKLSDARWSKKYSVFFE